MSCVGGAILLERRDKMAEIIPQGHIYLLKNVPLSPDYNNTFWFSSPENQRRHFEESYVSYSFTNNYYQRKSRGWLRLEADYKDVYNCNYLMWKNLPARNSQGTIVRNMYEDKWWYAFVDEVVYINDHVSEIHYSLDVIQSYFFDIVYEDTYVERYTVTNDNPGANMIDEGIPVGDYVYGNCSSIFFRAANTEDTPESLGSTNGMFPVIAATCTADYKDTTDSTQTNPVHITTAQGNMVLGCLLIDRNSGQSQPTAQRVKEWLDDLPGAKQGAILGIQMMPNIIRNHPSTNRYESVAILRPASVDGYTPKNKKLLSYPFNALTVISSDGSSQTFDYYQWQLSDNTNITFTLYVVYTYPLQGVLFPDRYKHNVNPATYAMPLPTLPSCTWSNDTFKAWAAMNTGYLATNIAGSALDLTMQVGSAIYGGQAVASSVTSSAISAGAMTPLEQTAFGAPLNVNGITPQGFINASQQGSTAGADFTKSQLNKNGKGIVGDLQNIANALVAIHNAKIMPDSFNGTAQGLASAISGNYGFFYAQRCIRADYAKQVDDYFTMFGYKVLKIMPLSREYLKVRQRFTYIKTTNMDIRGSIPSDDRDYICSIFNKGIRFWCDYVRVGNYNMDTYPNNPV